MSLPTISPSDAKRLLGEGAILVDIREADEHAREKIPGARLMPLSTLDEADFALHDGKPVVFHCKSGARTQGNASRLASKAEGTSVDSRILNTSGRRRDCSGEKLISCHREKGLRWGVRSLKP